MNSIRISALMQFCLQIAAFLSAIFITGCKEKHETAQVREQIINIGLIVPLDGPLWLFGRECVKGLELNIDECNAAGGVKDRKIALKIENNGGDPSRSAEAVKQFAADSSVLAIIGPITSNNFLAAAAVAQYEKIPILSPYSTSPSVTEIGEFVSRICFTDVDQGRVLARYAIYSLNLRKIAVLVERNNGYSEGLAKYFEREFTELGGKVCNKGYYAAQDQTYLPLLQSTFLQQPDGVFMPGYFPQARQLLKDVVTIGKNTTFLGGDGWESLEQTDLPIEVINDHFPIHITSHFSSEEMKLSAQHFVQQYENHYDHPPNSLSALAYDAAGIIVGALQRTARLDREALKEAINSTNGYAGATGTISLNEKRDAMKPVYIQEFRGGRFHLRAFNATLK